MANLKFLTVHTANGDFHTLRTLTDDGRTVLADYDLYPARPASGYLKWVGPAYMDNLGRAAWRLGRNVAGTLVAWKSVKVSRRFGRESYRMRSVPGGYKGDYVTSWSRAVNGKTYSFSRIFWNAGKEGCTLRVYAGQSTKVLHEWHVKGPVSMSKAKSA